MSQAQPIESVIAEASPAAKAPAVATTAAGVKLEMLGGDEIIELSIKPSPWFILLVGLRWLAVLALLGAAITIAMQHEWSREKFIAFQVVVGLAVLRVAVATLQWASRLYVLTNRRVMRFMGVFNVTVGECPLAKISRADLQALPYQRLLRLGTIQMTPDQADAPDIRWEQVAHPTEVYERLLRAIRRAQSKE